MAEGVFVAYYRVSTKGQGRSGLGLDAQREAVSNYLNGGQWSLSAAFTEVESGKRDDDRPELAKALQTCRVYGAKLVIAKLDRLSRDAHFLLGLEKAGVDFVAADMPHANRLTVGIMAMVADEERRAISERTKAALAAAKRRGVQLGGDRGARLTRAARKAGRDAQVARANERAADLAHMIRDLQSNGVTSLSGISWSDDRSMARRFPVACSRHAGRPTRRLLEFGKPTSRIARNAAHARVACGRLCLHRKRINLSTVLAGQKLGIKEVDDGIWLVSFMHYDLGYFDLEQKTLQPLDNPFGTRLSPMS